MTIKLPVTGLALVMAAVIALALRRSLTACLPEGAMVAVDEKWR